MWQGQDYTIADPDGKDNFDTSAFIKSEKVKEILS
jgi:hypothetical protein